MSLEDKTHKQFLILKEFFSTDSLHSLLDDCDYMTSYECKLLGIKGATQEYESVRKLRYTQQVGDLYESARDVNRRLSKDIKGLMVYQRRSEDQLEHTIDVLYKGE